VFVPILSNPKNNASWPEFVRNDVLKHVHEFSANVLEVRGKISGQTLLPMPMNVNTVPEQARIAVES